MAAHVRTLLAAVGEDTDREGLRDTPTVNGGLSGCQATVSCLRCAHTPPSRTQRVSKAFIDLMKGYKTPLDR